MPKLTPAPIPVPEITPAAYSSPEPSTSIARNAEMKAHKRMNTFRKHPRWRDIHHDIVTSTLSPIDICRKYDLRASSGCYAFVKVARYRSIILEKYKDVFSAANEMEQNVLRGEVLGKIRHVFDSASEGHELAKKQKTLIGRGKSQTLVDSPDFTAMKEQQETMLNAGSKLAELAGIGPTSQPTAPLYQDNRQVTILALPKAEGVPSRAPMKVLEAQR